MTTDDREPTHAEKIWAECDKSIAEMGPGWSTRDVLIKGIESFAATYALENDFSLHDPNDVKELARWLRNHLAGKAKIEKLAVIEPPTGPLPLSAVAVDEAEEALAKVRIADCCNLHGPACEPPSELCCANCTEAAHPDHAPGVSCVLAFPSPETLTFERDPATGKPRIVDDPSLLLLETREQTPGGHLGGGAMMTPSVGEDYWSYRVKLTDRQAILGFPKFATIGIGFAVEDDDWNTNLPYTVNAEEIYEHIACNKGDDKISRRDCIEAIRLIQAAIIRERAQADSPPRLSAG